MNTQQTNTKELLPCPFCGGEAVIEQKGRNGYKLKCKSCLIGITQKVLRNSMEWLKDKMIEDWNKRTTEKVELPTQQISEIVPTDLRIKEKAEEYLNEYASDFPPGNATCFAAGAKWMKDILLSEPAPLPVQQGAEEINFPIQFGRSLMADFEENTWTFEMPEDFKIIAGEFAIIPKENFDYAQQGK